MFILTIFKIGLLSPKQSFPETITRPSFSCCETAENCVHNFYLHNSLHRLVNQKHACNGKQLAYQHPNLLCVLNKFTANPLYDPKLSSIEYEPCINGK